MKKKNMIFIIAAAVLVIIIGVVCIILFGKKDKSLTLDQALTNYGSDFYENHYYANMKDKSILADFTESGLNISIKAAKVILPLDEKTEKMFNKNKCNEEETKLFFFPSDPYGAKDYKIKVELSCEK